MNSVFVGPAGPGSLVRIGWIWQSIETSPENTIKPFTLQSMDQSLIQEQEYAPQTRISACIRMLRAPSGRGIGLDQPDSYLNII